MSITKRIMEEDDDRGFHADDSITVCTNCFDDIGIKKFISTNGPLDGECDYCKDESGSTCDFETAMEHIIGSIHLEWSHPEQDGMSYNTREGGWLGKVVDTWELFATINFEANNPNLTNLIYNSIIDDQWCQRDHRSLSDDQIYIYGWNSFAQFVLHEARYVFFKTVPSNYDVNQHDEMNPVAILESLSTMVKKLDLITSINVDQSFYRVRIVDQDISLTTADELGAPPTEYCKIANRMSPAGISMFYGSFSESTAIKETYDFDKSIEKKAVCGVFKPTKDLKVLDLTKIPKIPSLFEEEFHEARNAIIFLHDFLKDFTKPILRDDRIHIDYVPTQIVAEYFRHCFTTKNGEKLHGVIYPSSKDKGKSSIVLFANNSQCQDNNSGRRITDTQLLKMNKIYDIGL